MPSLIGTSSHLDFSRHHASNTPSSNWHNITHTHTHVHHLLRQTTHWKEKNLETAEASNPFQVYHFLYVEHFFSSYWWKPQSRCFVTHCWWKMVGWKREEERIINTTNIIALTIICNNGIYSDWHVTTHYALRRWCQLWRLKNVVSSNELYYLWAGRRKTGREDELKCSVVVFSVSC